MPLTFAFDTVTNGIATLSRGTISETTGYIALDHSHHWIILSFRGTHDIRQWINNFGAIPRPVPSLCWSCIVHYGFWTAFQKAEDIVIKGIKEQQAAHPDYQVVVVGHSLGGALANLAAVVLRNNGIKADLYTYGYVVLNYW